MRFRLPVPQKKGHTQRLSDELLNETLFTSLAQARAVLTACKDDYNNARPHSALSNLTPTEYATRSVPGPQRGRTLRYAEGSAPDPVAPPGPIGFKYQRDSKRCRMKLRWQVRGNAVAVNFWGCFRSDRAGAGGADRW